MVRREIFHENCDVLYTAAKVFRQRIQCFFSGIDEMFALHPSPTETNKGTLTPSSRRLFRHHRHLLRRNRRLRLPLPLLPRLALAEGGHRQLPTDQKSPSRGILDVFCSCPMVRLRATLAT